MSKDQNTTRGTYKLILIALFIALYTSGAIFTTRWLTLSEVKKETTVEKSIVVQPVTYELDGFSKDSTRTMTAPTKCRILKTEYEIEIIDQNTVAIYNGSEVEVIPFDEIEEYINIDNM